MLEVSSSHLESSQQQGGDTIDGKGSRSKEGEGKTQLMGTIYLQLGKIEKPSTILSL